MYLLWSGRRQNKGEFEEYWKQLSPICPEFEEEPLEPVQKKHRQETESQLESPKGVEHPKDAEPPKDLESTKYLEPHKDLES